MNNSQTEGDSISEEGRGRGTCQEHRAWMGGWTKAASAWKIRMRALWDTCAACRGWALAAVRARGPSRGATPLPAEGGAPRLTGQLRPASSTPLDKELHTRPLRLSGATLLPKRKNFHTKWLVFFTFRFWRQGREVWSGWSLKAARKTHRVSAPPSSCEPHPKWNL